MSPLFREILLHKEKIQPAEGGSVGVRIELADSNNDSLNVVHFRMIQKKENRSKAVLKTVKTGLW